ncbi:hypothetical protein DPMN_124368 [Dreissena polymorpha]|uniref:Uncharacterized protein n=1 Tax=Dreissena polymorpha TaxID=45954 RepID=A0A9D4GW96_DREPO|nr:hypothetical protein DPMN_124368 [Dreissena polymorpha]
MELHILSGERSRSSFKVKIQIWGHSVSFGRSKERSHNGDQTRYLLLTKKTPYPLHHDLTLSVREPNLKAFANGLDPDETPQNVASHQDPNYKPNKNPVEVKSLTPD